MNILKKAYCRAFQFCFWAAFPLLPYREPEIVEGGLEGIPGVLRKEKKSHPLLVTDSGVVKAGLLDKLTSVLERNNVEYSLFTEVVANPTTDSVEKALSLYLEESCDSLIALGGGSSMDTAKAVGARIANPKKPLSKMGGILRVRHPIPTLLAIPTTAGTGSETTLASVIVDSETRHKYAINDFPLIPRYAVLDAEMTRTLPPHLTASTGMDALVHAIEAYIGKSNHKMTKIEAKIAVRLILSNIEKAYDDGNDMKARSAMLRASYLAGCSFTRSYVGYVHATSHTVGGEYNIPHGYANAVILPLVLEAYRPHIDKKLWKLAVAANLADELTPVKVGADAFMARIRELKEKFSIPDTIKEIRKEDIERLSKYADKEANPLYPVPVLMDAKELEVFYNVLRGQDNE